MPYSYVSIPTGSSNSLLDFRKSSFYGMYGDSITEALRTALWQRFLSLYYGSTSQAATVFYKKVDDGSSTSLSALLIANNDATWPPQELMTYKDHYLIEGLFSAALKSFFYEYAPTRTSPSQTLDFTNSDSTSYLVTSFANYLSTSTLVDRTAKKQNSIMLWLFELLSKILSAINDSTPTQGGYLLAMTSVEEIAANELSGLTYLTQSSADDYSSQTYNMNIQTKAEVLRANRSTAGKTGQMAQSMISTLRDQSTQQSQLMSTMMQSLETLFQSITKK